jgi:hypothetical protein
MKNYRINVTVKTEGFIELRAKDERAAREKTINIINDNGAEYCKEDEKVIINGIIECD